MSVRERFDTVIAYLPLLPFAVAAYCGVMSVWIIADWIFADRAAVDLGRYALGFVVFSALGIAGVRLWIWLKKNKFL